MSAVTGCTNVLSELGNQFDAIKIYATTKTNLKPEFPALNIDAMTKAAIMDTLRVNDRVLIKSLGSQNASIVHASDLLKMQVDGLTALARHNGMPHFQGTKSQLVYCFLNAPQFKPPGEDDNEDDNDLDEVVQFAPQPEPVRAPTPVAPRPAPAPVRVPGSARSQRMDVETPRAVSPAARPAIRRTTYIPPAKYYGITNAVIKKFLAEEQLRVSGVKEDLIRRLEEARPDITREELLDGLAIEKSVQRETSVLRDREYSARLSVPRN